MQNIRVRRYRTPNPFWSGTIEPEDRSWVIFVETSGEVQFWRRCSYVSSEGQIEEGYIDAELPAGALKVAEGNQTYRDETLPRPTEFNPLDFKVVQEGDEWCASLSCRAVCCYGATEHEAVRNLLNYVAQLCTAGCMDHTGVRVLGHNTRRYNAVWPDVNNPAAEILSADGLTEEPA